MAKVQFMGNTRGAPAWMADWANREHLALQPAKLDPLVFTDAAGIKVTLTANAAAAATSIAVTALTLGTYANTILIATGNVLIPAGTVLDFGTDEMARTTADAKIGDTSIAVAALPIALETGDTAYYSPGGNIVVPSGTIVGRTYAERDANTPFGIASLEGSVDDEIFLVAFDVVDLRNNNDCELYRNGERVKENYLPGYSALTAGGLAKIRALYQCFKGVD